MVRLKRTMCWYLQESNRAAACRGLIERNITAVAQGRRTKEEVLLEAVQCFRADFMIAAQKQGMPCSIRRC